MAMDTVPDNESPQTFFKANAPILTTLRKTHYKAFSKIKKSFFSNNPYPLFARFFCAERLFKAFRKFLSRICLAGFSFNPIKIFYPACPSIL
jgi:hypothetical protein